MKKSLKKLFSKITVGAMAFASVFSLSAVIVKNERDLSLQTALETTETATIGGGGQTPYNEPVEPNKGKIDDKKQVIKDDVYEEKTWIEAIEEYIAEQKEIDESFVYRLSGNGSKDNPYQIASAYDLAYLSYYESISVRFLRDKYLILINDICMNDGYCDEDGTYHDGGDGVLYKWTSSINSYQASFDGFNHTISGLYSSKSLFGTVCNGYCKNLILKNVFSTASSIVFEQVAWQTLGTYVENISVEGVMKMNGGGTDYAPIASSLNGCHFRRCVSRVKMIGTGRTCGGIGASGNANFYDCESYSYISSENKNVGNGGILGQGKGHSTIVLSNCKFYGEITGTQSFVGGIVGGAYTTNTVYKISNCENYGKCKNGIIGSCGLSAKIQMTECKNYGMTSYGGLASDFSSTSTMIDCENHSKTRCSSAFAGACTGRIYRCRNYANSDNGLVGTLQSGGVIEYCESNGNSSYYIGNTLNSGSMVKNCIIRGNVSNSKGIAGTNNATIDGVVFIGKIKSIQKNQCYGDDFSAFYINRKKDYIGLKALDDAGVYGICGLTKQYFIDKDFEVL